MGAPIPVLAGEWLTVVLCLAALVSVIRVHSPLSVVVFLLALDPLWATAIARLGLEARALPVVGAGSVAFAVHAPLWAALALGLGRLVRADRRGPDGAARSEPRG